MSNLVAVIIGALISALTSWLLKAREMEWQYRRVALDRLEEIAHLATETAEHYKRVDEYWFRRFTNGGVSTAKEPLEGERPHSIGRIIALLSVHARGKAHLGYDLSAAASGVELHKAPYLIAESDYLADSTTAQERSFTAAFQPLESQLQRVEKQCRHVIDEMGEHAREQIERQTRPIWTSVRRYLTDISRRG